MGDTGYDPRARQLDAINDAIDENRKTNAELVQLTKEIHKAVYGNGEPERGLRYRMSWLERIVRILIIAVAIESGLVLIVLAALAAHMSAT